MKKPKRILCAVLALLMLLSGCRSQAQPAQIAATTLPVYEFTSRLCEGTPLTVTRLVTESVSCLHDYSLNVRQVKAAEAAQVVVISGAGLEDFLDGILDDSDILDSSEGITLLHMEEEHDHGHEDHRHEDDPHIWLSPENAKIMAGNICTGLSQRYPEYADTFSANLDGLLDYPVLADAGCLALNADTDAAGLKAAKSAALWLYSNGAGEDALTETLGVVTPWNTAAGTTAVTAMQVQQVGTGILPGVALDTAAADALTANELTLQDSEKHTKAERTAFVDGALAALGAE